MKPSIFAPIILALAFGIILCGCGASGTTDPQAASTPISEVDALINQYEKTLGECVRMAKKHTTGDVSVTVLLIVARKTFEDEGVKLKESAGKLSPQQAQRVAAIAAKAAPCLGR